MPRDGTLKEWKDDKGSCSMTRTTAEVLRVDVRDYLSEDLGKVLTEALAAEIENSQRIHTFFDGEYLQAYHSYVRIGLTAVLLNNAAKVQSINVLARSTLVHMGVAVANLALSGRIRAFGERSAFEDEFARVLGRAPSLPPARQRLG